MGESEEPQNGGQMPEGPDWMMMLIPIAMLIAAVVVLFYSNIVKTGLLR